MEVELRQLKRREDAISSLNASIETLNLAENDSSIAPAKVIFGSVNGLLMMIRDSMVDELDYVELGLFCAGICRALDRGVCGKKLKELSRSDCGGYSEGPSKRNVVSRRVHSKDDKETIASWKLDLDKILRVFDKELASNANSTIHRNVANAHTIAPGVRNDVVKTGTVFSNTHRNTSKSPEDTRGQDRMTHASAPEESLPPPPRSTHGAVSNIRRDVVKTRDIVSELETNVTSTQAMVSDIHRTMMRGQGGSDGKNFIPNQASTPGEWPPRPPRACFGRDELIDKIVGLAENLIPVALIGAGGIGKTSVALTVLHHDRIKQRFGDNRRFIRCDQFPASFAHLLGRLSKVTGAGIGNPEDLGSLRPFLSSREILIVLDNAEFILDPSGTDVERISAVVEELSQFDNIYLCITSRITAIPSDCETFDVPTLSIDAACATFYRIYKSAVERADVIDDILTQLDFHPLSITLLATVGHQNKWNTDRLAREWEIQRTRMLQTLHSKSLATTIELSLSSPMFQELGPDARSLLEVIAFFPQGVDENNLDWLFPAISNGTNILDKFCVLSLTCRSDSFITMLAPLRDHLRPKDPKSSPLLCLTKERYFTRMLVRIDPNKCDNGETRWIVSEDVNVEYLLDVFTTVDANSDEIWDACAGFVEHLYWHKQRPIILGSMIEGLPDDHPSKPNCLFQLAGLLSSVGNSAECKRLLTHTLQLYREQESDYRVFGTLLLLSRATRHLGPHEEAIQQAQEALELFERLDDTEGQTTCLLFLGLSLKSNNKLDAAEKAASRAMDLLSEKGDQFLAWATHRLLGYVFYSKGKTEKAIHHYEAALRIASPFNWPESLFWIHRDLARLFLKKGRFDDAQAHIERAKPHAVNNVYTRARATKLQAKLWYRQHRLEEARSEISCAADVFENIGATTDLESCRKLLKQIDEEMSDPKT